MRLTTLDATYINQIELPTSGVYSNVDFKIYKNTLTVVIKEYGIVL